MARQYQLCSRNKATLISRGLPVHFLWYLSSIILSDPKLVGRQGFGSRNRLTKPFMILPPLLASIVRLALKDSGSSSGTMWDFWLPYRSIPFPALLITLTSSFPQNRTDTLRFPYPRKHHFLASNQYERCIWVFCFSLWVQSPIVPNQSSTKSRHWHDIPCNNLLWVP